MIKYIIDVFNRLLFPLSVGPEKGGVLKILTRAFEREL